MTKLVIVESPTKAKTISRFLGRGFKVESSYGRVRDLPKSTLGIEVETNFKPKYIIPAKARKVVAELKKEAEHSEEIILATDEDREGEAIAWHIAQVLNSGSGGAKNQKQKIKNIERIVFHEITENAIKEALEHPRLIDMKRVDAQQARRILDRLVGYKLSPFLWKKLYRGLSAGRVQSVALRLVAEREREIQGFKPEEYWTIEALLKTKTTAEEFKTILVKINEETLDKFALKNRSSAENIVKELEGKAWYVEKIEKRAISKNPLPPFTTSTLQQEAFRRLGFSPKFTMRCAQELYEGILLEKGPQGLITYMRTDSLNLSEESLTQAAALLKKELGVGYALPSPRHFKTKTKGAQEAHEAIRPTEPARTAEAIKKFLNQRQFKLYDLIWRRFMACQMPQALFDATSVDIQAGTYTFRASGQIIKFDGFLKLYPMKFQETELPELERGEILELATLTPWQHFTEPPGRYTEASLVKILEKYGIGRPSTYAPTISTIQERRYVEKDEKRRLIPSELGFMVNEMLVEHFPEIVDIQFTAKMEKDLDEIASGKIEWQPVIREFYEPFAKHLTEKYEKVERKKLEEKTEERCEKCGRPMVIKPGRFGKFLACSGFPECKNAKSLPPVSLGIPCPKCYEGEITQRSSRRGRIFYGCSRWPACDFASWDRPSGELCPQCSSPLLITKKGLKCSSKSCDFETRSREAKGI